VAKIVSVIDARERRMIELLIADLERPCDESQNQIPDRARQFGRREESAT
jgi:hypothetical protein